MNRNRITSLALAGALALGMGGAQAATLSADMNITATVDASCDFGGPGDQYFILGDQGGNANTDGTAQVVVNCSLNLPYIIEADAGPDGELTLTNATSGETLPVFLRYDQGGGSYVSAWGTQANAEHWSGTGTGTFEFKRFQMLVNGPGSSGQSTGLPGVGTYVQTLNLTLTY
jgi:spore coat protein U-like protein